LPVTSAKTFSGAVGSFTVHARVEQKTWSQNNSGKLQVTLNGAGNFMQLSAPEIHWPKGIEVFEPTITERLQNEAVPVAGSRTYTYTFTADSTGTFTIPPVAFTYFNPAQKKYQTVYTDSVHFTIQQASIRMAVQQRTPARLAKPQWYGGLLAGAVLLLGGFIFFAKKFRKKETPVAATKPETPDYEKRIRAILPADTNAYRQLQQVLMDFLKSSEVPVVTTAQNRMQPVAAALPLKKKENLQAILDECEAVQYYKAQPTVSFSTLQQQALSFIRSANEA